ncbi:MAG: hypothetical protein HY913_23565 [Desulfomonile tiedjei]|nr:hypothetical protein [Desulfomonile tiedjei]
MGRLIATLAIALTVAVWFDSALAAGNHRFELDRKAKQVQTWQEAQDKRFKALEAESTKFLKKIESENQLREPVR